VERKDVEQRIKPVLVQLMKLIRTRPPASVCRDVEREAVHQSSLTRKGGAYEQAQHEAAPRNCEQKNSHFCVASRTAREKARSRKVDNVGASADGVCQRAGAKQGDLPG